MLSNTPGYGGFSDTASPRGDAPSAPPGPIAYGTPIGVADPPPGGDGGMLGPSSTGWSPGGLQTGPLAAPAPVPYQAPAPMPMLGGRPAKRAVLCGCNYAYASFCHLCPTAWYPYGSPGPWEHDLVLGVFAVVGRHCRTEGGFRASCFAAISARVTLLNLGSLCACLPALYARKHERFPPCWAPI